MKTLSLVMIVKNEEKVLERCLDSCKDIVDEIIVVDTGSTDNTKNIANRFNAKVYDYKWDNNFSNARNFAISKSTSDFNLILDADEYITKIKKESLFKFMNSNKKYIGKIKLVDLFEQDKKTRKSISFLSRLAPKNVFYNGSIHEQLDESYDRIIVDIEVEHDGYLNKNKSSRNIGLILNELNENPNDVYMLYQAGKTYYTDKQYNNSSIYFDKFYSLTNFENDNFYVDGVLLYIYNCIKTKEFDKGLKIIDDNIDILNNRCDFYFTCGLFFTELVAHNPKKYSHFFENIKLCYMNAINIGEDKFFDGVEGTGSYLASYNLGVYFELIGDKKESEKYYKIASDLAYN